MNDNLNRDSGTDARIWQERYENQQTGWERGETHPALIAWCGDQTIKPPCHVVIPGCGRGHEVIHLAQQGFVVSAIDFAAAPIEYLKGKLEDHDASVFLQQQDVFDFAPATAVDAVYEQTCLCAIPPDRRLEYEQTLYRWLKPGGLLLALFMQTNGTTEGPPFHCGMDEMKQLFPANRWNWKSDTFIRFDHPSIKIHELSAVLEKCATQ